MQQEEVRCLAMYLDMSEKDLRKIIELMRNKNPEYIKEAIINCDGNMYSRLINQLIAVFS